MKFIIILAAVLASVSSQGYRGYRQPQEEQYAPTPYNFNYVNEADAGTSSHQETGDGAGGVTGSYTVTNEDGSSRVVDYVADEGGFRANVRTNEPGTESAEPADVVIESTAEGARGPVLQFGNSQSQSRPQYGQSYNQPRYGYNQPQYRRPQYNSQPQYGYNRPQYGQPQYYNAPQYGPPQYYNQPQYGQPQY